MKKTAFFACVAVVAIAGGFYILQIQKDVQAPTVPQAQVEAPRVSAHPVEVPPVVPPEAISSEMDVSKANSSPPVPPPVDRTPTTQTYSKAELRERKELAELKQAEIQQLMEEYNQNLSNPDKRKEIQASINELMDQYNELVLPVAVAEMKESNP